MGLVGRESLISPDDTWGLLAAMCLGVFGAIWLEQRYKWAAKVSGVIVALVIAMLLANIGILPVGCDLYDNVVWGIIVPMSIPMLLLQCDLKRIWSETGRLLLIFLVGAAGTIAGAFLAYYMLKGSFQDSRTLAKVIAMMTGTYIGGSVNLVAIATQYECGAELTAAATVADNLLMAAYFFVLIAVSGMKLFRSIYAHPLIDNMEKKTNAAEAAETPAAAFWKRKDISLKDIAVNVMYAVCVVYISRLTSDFFSGFEINSVVSNMIVRFLGSQYVWITTFSVLIATAFSDKINKIHGSSEIGTYLIYMFFFVIGVPADLYMVITKSPMLLVLTGTMVSVNMLFCFLAARIFKFNLEEAIIASNANIGGPTTAAGMAISQGWISLAGPAMLIGTLGYVLGNYMGTLVAIALVI